MDSKDNYMDNILSKIKNNLNKEGVDEIAINDILLKVKTYWDYIGNINWDNAEYVDILQKISIAKFIKAKFNDDTKYSVMQKTLVYEDNSVCIFKPTNFQESHIIGEPICCFTYSQERWDEYYNYGEEAVYYVYDAMRENSIYDFVAITVQPSGRALVFDREHKWWSPSKSMRYIKGLGEGAASLIVSKDGKTIKTENIPNNI